MPFPLALSESLAILCYGLTWPGFARRTKFSFTRWVGWTIKSNSSRWTHERGQKGRMAGRLRGVQRQCVEFVGGGAVYTKSGRASSKDEFRGGGLWPC